MSHESKETTAFVTHAGVYPYDVMTFGRCDGASMFSTFRPRLHGRQWNGSVWNGSNCSNAGRVYTGFREQFQTAPDVVTVEEGNVQQLTVL